MFWIRTSMPANTLTESLRDDRAAAALGSHGRRFILEAQAAPAYVRWLIVDPMLGLWVAVAVGSRDEAFSGLAKGSTFHPDLLDDRWCSPTDSDSRNADGRRHGAGDQRVINLFIYGNSSLI